MHFNLYIIPINRPLLIATGATALLSVSGCSTMGPPDQQLTQAETKVQKAESIGAARYAQQSYQLAEAKLSKAWSAYQDHDYLEAKRLAEKASADATLAHVTTTNRKLKSAIDKLNEEIKYLKKELQEKSS